MQDKKELRNAVREKLKNLTDEEKAKKIERYF